MTTLEERARKRGPIPLSAGALVAGTLLSAAFAISGAVAAPAQADVCANYADFPGTKPQDDSDGDCLPTWAEQVSKTNPNNPDTDGDKISDLDEVVKHKTDPNKLDTDGDTENDFIELFVFKKNPLDPNSHSDAVGTSKPAPPRPDAPKPPTALEPRGDADFDGLLNEDETNVYGTNPRTADSDGDGPDDGQEVFDGTDPLDPNDP